MKFKPNQWKIWSDVKKLEAEEKEEAQKKKQQQASMKDSMNADQPAEITEKELEEIGRVFDSFFSSATKSTSRSPTK